MKELFKQMGKLAWYGIRYILVTGCLALLVLTVVTGKFPPPAFEMYKAISQHRDALDVGKNLSDIQSAQMENAKTMKHLREVEGETAGRVSASAAQVEEVNLREVVKVLEYQVASLKAKVNRLEAENQACSKAKVVRQ